MGSVFLQTLFSFGFLYLRNRVLYTYMIVFMMKSRADASLNIDNSSIVLEQDKHLFNELIVSYLMITSRTNIFQSSCKPYRKTTTAAEAVVVSKVEAGVIRHLKKMSIRTRLSYLYVSV